ncbi:hypothetical protein Ciccas_014123 [Cichlidogyrus casuarinus]|uniref:Uncharacterized protein n=1 Tax=Cichlidogyrus casuarinus TaxID=1844966 RepID=A0ABD2PIW2_9PLAT
MKFLFRSLAFSRTSPMAATSSVLTFPMISQISVAKNQVRHKATSVISGSDCLTSKHGRQNEVILADDLLQWSQETAFNTHKDHIL